MTWPSPWSNQIISLLILVTPTGAFSGLFVYSPVPELGSLILSIAAAAGTDPFGNAYPAGLTVGADPNPQVNITSQSGTGIIQFLLNSSSFKNALIQILGGSFAQLSLIGPARTAIGHTDYTGFLFNSSDGASSANAIMEYVDYTGVIHDSAIWSAAGFSIPAGVITGVEPGTGTVLTPATAEIWHYVGNAGQPAFQADWSNHGGGYANCAFKLLSEKNMVWINGFAVPAAGAANTVFNLPTGYIPVSQQQYAISSSNTGVSGYVSVSTTGGVSVNMDGGLVTGNIYMLDGFISLDI